MATPTFNKYKSTTIFGNLSVRDLTNSSGSSVVEVASVDLSGNFISSGDSTFTKKVVCNALLADINANNILTTKEYVDSVASGGGDVTLAGTNAFTGTNSFNTNLPTSTQTPTTSTQLTTKNFVDDAISGLSSVYQTISGMSSYLTTTSASSTYSTITNQVKTNIANTFSAINTFNSETLFNSNITSPYFLNRSTTENDTFTNTISLTSQGNDLYTNNVMFTLTQNSNPQNYTGVKNVSQSVLQPLTNYIAGTYSPNIVTINTPISIKTQGTTNVGTNIAFTITNNITSINAQVFVNDVFNNNITGTINSSNVSSRTTTCSYSAGGNKSFNLEQYFYNFTFDINLSAYPTGIITIRVCPTIATTITITSFTGNFNLQITPSYNINSTISTITDTGTSVNRTISHSPNSNGTGYSALSIGSASSSTTIGRGLTTGTTYVNKIYTNGLNQNTTSTTTNTLNNLTINNRIISNDIINDKIITNNSTNTDRFLINTNDSTNFPSAITRIANDTITFTGSTMNNAYLSDSNTTTINFNQELTSGNFNWNSTTYKLLTINFPLSYSRVINCNYAVAGTISSNMTISTINVNVYDSTLTTLIATGVAVNLNNNSLSKTIDLNIGTACNGTQTNIGFISNFETTFSLLYQNVLQYTSFRIFITGSASCSLTTTITGGNKTYTASFTPSIKLYPSLLTGQNTTFTGTESATTTFTPTSNGIVWVNGSITAPYRIMTNPNTSYFSNVRAVSLQASNMMYTPTFVNNTNTGTGNANYTNSKMPVYLFTTKSNAATTLNILMSLDTHIDDGQYFYVRSVNVVYNTNLSLNAGSGTTIFSLAGTSVTQLILSSNTSAGGSFLYDKTNLRWIQLSYVYYTNTT